MSAGDYEAAVGHVRRFRLDVAAAGGSGGPGEQEKVSPVDAAAAAAAAAAIFPPLDYEAMLNAESALRDVVVRSFDAAVAAGDAAAVMRFCELFEALGMGEQGLERYIDYIRGAFEEHAAVAMSSLATADDDAVVAPALLPALSSLLNTAADMMARSEALMASHFASFRGPVRMINGACAHCCPFEGSLRGPPLPKIGDQFG
jgi:hypothetical protein